MSDEVGKHSKWTPGKISDLIDWLRNEAEERMGHALSRKDSSRAMRKASAKELRESQALAEKMSGRKLPKTTVAEARADANMQESISGKLEREARQLYEWSDVVQKAPELAEALEALLEIIRRGDLASAKDVETCRRAEKLLSEVVG